MRHCGGDKPAAVMGTVGEGGAVFKHIVTLKL